MKIRKDLLLFAVSIPAGCAFEAGEREEARASSARAPAAAAPLSTFSIVARDPANGDLGVAVQSKFFAVGAVVPWAEAGAGAIATQSFANVSYGPRGLELLRQGEDPETVLKKLTEADADRDRRQVGIIDAAGRSATYTGKGCFPWAGGKRGENFAVQGNILVSAATVEAMAAAFPAAKGELAERLVAAMEAGQKAGGDVRGRQSAAIVVMRKGAGYAGFSDRYIDLRVEDHPDPIAELRRLVEMRLEKDPLSRTHALVREGEADKALEVLRQGQRAYPAWDALLFEEAWLLFAVKETAAAKESLAKALARHPEHDDAHFLAARLLAGAGIEKEALDEIRRTLEINPEYARALERELESAKSEFSPFKERILKLLKGEK